MLLPVRYRRLANLSTALPSGRPHRCGPALRAHSDRCPRPSAWPRSLRAVKSFPAFFIFKTHAAVDCVILQFGNDELRPSGLIPANNANQHQVDGANPGAAGTGGRALDGVTGRRQVSWFEWTYRAGQRKQPSKVWTAGISLDFSLQSRCASTRAVSEAKALRMCAARRSRKLSKLHRKVFPSIAI